MGEFQARVLKLVLKVPRGRVTTYKNLALALGSPHAYRAVGNALARNLRPIEIPCHRVVKSSGEIGGYKLGTKRKVMLLVEDGIEVHGTKVDLKKYLFEF